MTAKLATTKDTSAQPIPRFAVKSKQKKVR